MNYGRVTQHYQTRWSEPTLPAGVLRGCESIELEWSFAPTAERNYLVKVRAVTSRR